MKKMFLFAAFTLLAGCNDKTDVVVVTGNFKHTAQFEERGLTMTVIHLDDVVDALNENDLPTTRKQVAQKHMLSINNMAAGTVILNFGGGYEAAVAALTTYEGRKIYCAGIDFWGVSAPEGCIPIGSIYNKLNKIAPVSLKEWQASQSEPGSPPEPEEVVVPRVWIHDYYVIVTDESKLPNAREILEITDYYGVYDATGSEYLSEYACASLFHCRHHYSEGYIFGLQEYNGRADHFDESFIQYFMADVRPDCEPVLWAWSQTSYAADGMGGSNDQYYELREHGYCWIGPTNINPENGLVVPDYDVLD